MSGMLLTKTRRIVNTRRRRRAQRGQRQAALDKKSFCDKQLAVIAAKHSCLARLLLYSRCGRMGRSELF